MSTKTTFKRIALVTVAALGFGVMATAPSNAALAGAPLGVTQTLSAATTTVTAGTAAKVTLTTAGYFTASDTVTSTISLTGFSSGVTAAGVTQALTPVMSAIDTLTAGTNGDGTVSAGGSQQAASGQGVEVWLGKSVSSLISTATQIKVTLDVPGTYTYTIQNLNKAGSTAASTDGTATKLTWTVVVTAPVLTSSKVFITTATAAGAVATADSTTLTADGTAAATAVARIDVSQYMDAVPTLLTAGYTKAVVVAVTGAGALSSDGGSVRGTGVTEVAGTITAGVAAGVANYSDYFLHSDGRTGKATITVSVDGTLVATKTFMFTGKLASYSVVESNKNIGVGETGTLTVTGKDANLNDATALGTVTAVSSDALIATAAVVGGVVTVTGVKVGTATITLMNATTAAAATITKVVTVTILPTTAPTIAWKLDKDSYDAGEKMTLTITAAGIADGARAVFGTAPSTNFTLSGAAPTWTTTPTFAAGVATVTMYAPATPGTFVISATIGQKIDTEVVLKTAADTKDAATVPVPTTATYSATKVSVSATITNPALTAAQEATDAANEATDAGNNAKDAADQAIEAADAATIAAQDAQAAADAAKDAAEQAGQDAVDAAAEATDAANNAADIAAQAIESADAATAAAEEAAAAATAAGEMAVEAAEAAGAIAQDALDAANAATDAALSAAEAADAATAAATEAKESADAATAAVAELSTKVAALMAALNAKVTTLSNLVAKIAKKVKA